jgi:hypothetical protein
MNIHTLLNKTNHFMLTYHKTKKGESWVIQPTLAKRLWASTEELDEMRQFFPVKGEKIAWVFDNELDARNMMNWTILRWPPHV